MVYSDNTFKINISKEERKELIKNFKIGVLYQLYKEGYFSSEQVNQMIKEINS